MSRRLRKHRLVLTLTVGEPVTREEATSYVEEAVELWHGQRIARYAPQNEGYENEDSILLGEVRTVVIHKTAKHRTR